MMRCHAALLFHDGIAQHVAVEWEQGQEPKVIRCQGLTVQDVGPDVVFAYGDMVFACDRSRVRTELAIKV